VKWIDDTVSDSGAATMWNEEERVKLYADEDISPVLVNKLNGLGYNIKRVQDLGHAGRSDLFQVEVANEQERCIITHNENDFLALRNQIKYGLVIVRCKDRTKYPLSIIAYNAHSVLLWGKKFFEREVVVLIHEDHLIVEYRTKDGTMKSRYWEFKDGTFLRRIEDLELEPSK